MFGANRKFISMEKFLNSKTEWDELCTTTIISMTFKNNGIWKSCFWFVDRRKSTKKGREFSHPISTNARDAVAEKSKKSHQCRNIFEKVMQDPFWWKFEIISNVQESSTEIHWWTHNMKIVVEKYRTYCSDFREKYLNYQMEENSQETELSNF